MIEKKYKLRGATPEEIRQDRIKFLYNPPPEWVEGNHFEQHYDKVDGEYYLRKEERPMKKKKKLVHLQDTGHKNQMDAEVDKKSTNSE